MASAYHWEARRRQMALDRRRHYQLQQELKNKKIENDLEEQRYCMGLEPYQRYRSPSPGQNYMFGNLSPQTSHQNAGAFIAGQAPENLRGSFMIPERQTMPHCRCQCQCHFQGQCQLQNRRQVQEGDQDDNDQDEVEIVVPNDSRDRDRHRHKHRDLYLSRSQDRARSLGKGHRQSKSQVRDRERGKSPHPTKEQCQTGHHTSHHHHKVHNSHQQASHPQEFKHSASETLRHPKRGKRYTALDYIQQW